MRLFFFLAAIGLTILPVLSTAASRHSTSKRTRHHARASHQHARSRHTAKHVRRRRRRSHRVRARRYQLHPTVARYKQIQQALASAGYYDGEIDGQWGPKSVSALQRFQTEQGIANEGKITALALIGLGLGPKHKHMTLPIVPPGTAQPADDSETAADSTRESKSLPPGNTVAESP